MTFLASATKAAERLPLSDTLLRAGIRQVVQQTHRRIAANADQAAAEQAFAAGMLKQAIATYPSLANAQQFDLPPEFFDLVLGPRRKYSCCFYETAEDTLAMAEERALSATAAHAALKDGQSVLELGCGWGAFSIWMAEVFPRSRITAVAHSQTQKLHVEKLAEARGLDNLRVVAADMNSFAPSGTFDRIVSIEMFEHMANWTQLLDRIATWLRPQGKMFLQVFSHRSLPYRYDHTDRGDWMGQHFMAGSMMPSHGLIHSCTRSLVVEEEWRWSGDHYRRTAQHWLANCDMSAPRIRQLLDGFYGKTAALWLRRWRMFFMAIAGLFGHAGGSEWGVSQYRLRRA